MRYQDPETGEMKEISVKAADTLPIGTIVDYDGDEVPPGWEEVEETDIITDKDGVKVGIKIDGKDLYAKRINFGPLPEAKEKTVDTGLKFAEVEIIGILATGYSTTGDNLIGLPTVKLGGAQGSVEWGFNGSNGKIFIYCNTDQANRSMYSVKPVILYIYK